MVASKADPVPVWVEGLGGWRTSQTAVKADLGGRASAVSAWQPVFGNCWDTGAGASAVRTQAVWVAPAGTSASLSCVVLSGAPVWFLGRVGAAPDSATREEQSRVSGCS